MRQWHLTLSSTHRSTFFPDEGLLRAAVRTLDRVVGEILVMFCIVDSHVHLWILAHAERIGFIAGGLRRALAPLAVVEIDVVHHRSIETRRHSNSMIGYMLDQLRHHGIEGSAATWAGTCYQDLVGARLLDNFRPRIRRLLPRLGRADLDRAVGIPSGSLREATPEQIRRAGAAGAVDAAAAALAVGPTLEGKARPVTRARRAACQVATLGGALTGDLSEALELPARTIRRLLAEPVEPELLRAVQVQIALRGTGR